jgi:hypothetical protein
MIEVVSSRSFFLEDGFECIDARERERERDRQTDELEYISTQ